MDKLDNHEQIEGVVVQPLKQIVDERGAVLHMLRKDSPLFMGFGEIYFSEVKFGVVKAWKRHKKMTQHFAVPYGKILLVIYDSREHSKTYGKIKEYLIGRPEYYNLLIIPPQVYYGFKGLNDTISLIANCADIPHSPEETEKIERNNNIIPYQWN